MYIVFDDGAGDTICRNAKTAPADRASNWVPANYRPIGDAAHMLADEARVVFAVRMQHGASFELRGIPMGDEVDGPLDVAERLIAHLLNGGTCKLYLEDVLAASYLNCGIDPEVEPSLVQSDRTMLEYTLSLGLINLAGSPMTCHYRA